MHSRTTDRPRSDVGSLFARLVQPSLARQVPRNHHQDPRDFRRRQVVTALFVLVGGGVLSFSLRITPGSSTFYVSTLLLAGVWTVGAFASGPLYLGRIDLDGVGGMSTGGGDPSDAAEPEAPAPLPRPVIQPILIGAALAAIFVVGGLVVRKVDFLDAYVRSVLDYANQGYAPLLLLVAVLNGVAEELFFRGAVYAAIPRRPVLWTTLIYVVATLATGNVMLGFAAIVVGTVVALQRRASGGILAPILTHVIWSVTMFYALPAIFF